MTSFTLLITTHNRKTELLYTLSQCADWLHTATVMICDDACTDGTYEAVHALYPHISWIRHRQRRGLIASRNELKNATTTPYALSIDDDLHLITPNALAQIQSYFEENPQCGVQSFRTFWGLEAPQSTQTHEQPHVVSSFLGGAHAWRMDAWRSIPNYPAWFVFYGEEDFASYQLFKKNWDVHYAPFVLAHHRVSLQNRKKHPDYQLRLRRSLRSGWFLMGLFYPLHTIPRLGLYTLWIQIKNKTLKGDIKGTLAIMQALIDVVTHLPLIIKNKNRFSQKEWLAYKALPKAKIYWKPEI